MQLTITNEAKEIIIELGFNDNHSLLLLFDREGLGCSVHGQPTVRFAEKIDSTYKQVDNPTFPTYIDTEDEIYFEENLTLDYADGKFKLKSPNEILNALISPASLNR